MSTARTVITGFTTEPVQRIAQSGKAMLDISVAHTPRRKNQQTGQWEDVTDKDGNDLTLWVRARFFEAEADHLAQHVAKGTFVEIEGEPRLNVYEDKGGRPAASLELHRPVLKIIPRAPRSATGAGSTPPATVGASDPWGASQAGAQGSGGFNEEQPF